VNFQGEFLPLKGAFAMTGWAWKADGVRQQAVWRRMRHGAFALTGVLASIYPAIACDGMVPPLNALATQKALVDVLQVHVEGVREEERVGQRTVREVLDAEEEYFIELETQRAMEACSAGGKSTPRAKVLEARLKTASDYLKLVKQQESATADRFQVGEVTRTEVAFARATALRAEIRLKALKQEAGN
jgi:hypothetical protein